MKLHAICWWWLRAHRDRVIVFCALVRLSNFIEILTSNQIWPRCLACMSNFKSIAQVSQAGQTSCFEDIIPVSVGTEFIASRLGLELKATTSSCWKEISTEISKCSCMYFVCCVVVCFAPTAMHIKSLEVTRFCSVVGILAKVVLLHSIPQCWHFLSLISMRGGRSSSVLHIMNTSILPYLLRELTPPSRPPTIIHAMFQLSQVSDVYHLWPGPQLWVEHEYRTSTCCFARPRISQSVRQAPWQVLTS